MRAIWAISGLAASRGWNPVGVRAGVADEMNRYGCPGCGAAGMNWLEPVWPGNDAIKVQFLAKLRETRVKSAFADDLRVLSTDTR